MGIRTAVRGYALLIAVVSAFLPHAAPADDEPVVSDESRHILQSDGLAVRSGDKLSVRANNGTATEFRDENVCGENGGPFDHAHCVHYLYAGHDQARHGHLIYAASYEDSSFVWIGDMTGVKSHLHGAPRFSPDGRHFIAVVASDSGWNGIQAGTWEPDGSLSIQWEFEPETYALYAFSSWIDDGKVALRVTRWRDGALVELPATLSWTRAGWTISG
jgi:hypothetical protein